MPEEVIRVRGLRKSYGSLEAVRGLDFSIQRGEVFALLGPNGAGKTTTVEILEGYRDRSAGEVSVLGHDPGRREPAYKRRIGIVLQSSAVEPYLTVEETIDLFRGYYPRPRPTLEVLELVGLAEQRRMRVKKLSGGQQRRLDVAVGLAGDPELLFLDEPTTGFDPSARRQAWQMLRDLSGLGKTILLTTHYMDEAQSLAGRVAIMAAGRIVAEGDPRGLGERGAARTRISFRAADAPPPGFGITRQNGIFEAETDDPVRLLHQLTRWALDHRIELDGLTVSRPSLEDVYLRLTEEAAAG